MGRSQVKYRATHGAAAGEEEANRQADAEERRGEEGRPTCGVWALTPFASRSARRRKMTPSRRNKRATMAGARSSSRRSRTTGSRWGRSREYFQSRAMKQWEEKDDAADDQAAVGVLVSWLHAAAASYCSSLMLLACYAGPGLDRLAVGTCAAGCPLQDRPEILRECSERDVSFDLTCSFLTDGCVLCCSD